MNSFSKWLTGLGIVAGVVVVGLAVGWLASRDPGTKAPAPPNTFVNTRPAHPSAPGSDVPPRPVPVAGGGPAGTNVVDGSPATAPGNLITNWDDRLEEILVSETDDTNKLKQLFALFPRLPEEGQAEVALHLSNLVDDEDYAPLGKLLENPKLPESVLDVLMADLLNRPNGVKLPMFLDIARNPDHAKAEEARELLELYLDEEYGTDWPKWEEKLKAWMKENPD
jgi:hypothetical protein